MSSKMQKRNRQNKLIYNILNITENTKEKDCIAADKKNEKKYRETIEKLGITTKEWENTGVMLNLEIPTPPCPSNYERLLEYRRTHVLRPAIVQSEATIYLHERGYKLGEDYQAYQAIEIVNKLQEYDRETSLPEINTLSTTSQDINSLDLDVFNVSRLTGKKRHSFSQGYKKNRDSATNSKTRPFSSLNYGSFKRKNTAEPRKTQSADPRKKETFKEEIRGKGFDCEVSNIVKRINQEQSAGKPKSRFNTIRKKQVDKSRNQPPSGLILNDSITSKYEANKVPSSYPTPYAKFTHSYTVEPSAPPLATEYNTQHNSDSSVDSLFDSEEMKQFEKKYHHVTDDSSSYTNQQKKYNGIYPYLSENNEDEDDDFCSV